MLQFRLWTSIPRGTSCGDGNSFFLGLKHYRDQHHGPNFESSAFVTSFIFLGLGACILMWVNHEILINPR